MRITDVRAQKIDGFSLAIFGIVIAVLQVVDKLGCSLFFKQTFLLANIGIKVILGMPFLSLAILTSNLLKKSSPREHTLPKKSF